MRGSVDDGWRTRYNSPRFTRDLILENVFRFSIQLIGKLVDSSHLITGVRFGRFAEKPANRFRDERRAIGRDLIDLLR
ncbi:MAG TPA: hypothetical protein VNA69_02795 [Thermoanaerobaculia bacterium]|nr:hypothetical protein [Thermoanaerobaculia bacterium]